MIIGKRQGQLILPIQHDVDIAIRKAASVAAHSLGKRPAGVDDMIVGLIDGRQERAAPTGEPAGGVGPGRAPARSVRTSWPGGVTNLALTHGACGLE
ncbi:MAG: hypothetical protein R2706_00625 [Acidimicrobiales bacterium]